MVTVSAWRGTTLSRTLQGSVTLPARSGLGELAVDDRRDGPAVDGAIARGDVGHGITSLVSSVARSVEQTGIRLRLPYLYCQNSLYMVLTLKQHFSYTEHNV